jgi:hypothetical protein
MLTVGSLPVGGQLLVGLATAQPAGKDHLVRLDRHRADAAGQARHAPVPPGVGSATVRPNRRAAAQGIRRAR